MVEKSILLTVIFGLVYIFYYHFFGAGNLQEAEYLAMVNKTEAATEMTSGGGIGYKSPYSGDNVTQRKANTGDLASAPTPEPVAQTFALLTDEASRRAGKEIWITNCSVCHLVDGGGMIGPNMTDNYWIHGNKMADLINTINVGVLTKGMTPWKEILSDEQIQQVSSYILSDLVGSTPAVAKGPQGTKSEE